MPIRPAVATDIPDIIRLRTALFGEMGKGFTPEQIAVTEHALANFFATHGMNGDVRIWLAEEEGQVVASGFLALYQRLPHPGNLSGKEAYLGGIYTEPAWRKRGLARQITQSMMDFAAEIGLGRVMLHASDDGRPLYESLGFIGRTDYLEWNRVQASSAVASRA